MAKDYYAILGVKKESTEDEIKKAFRRLAHEHHPDKGGNAQKFKDINDAYQVLGDKQKRKTYDQFGSAAFEGGAQGAPGGFGQGFGGFDFGSAAFQGQDFGDLGDVLGEMFGFGGNGRQTRQAKGKDIELDAELSFRDAAFGVRRSMKLYKHSACSRCRGEGAEPGTSLETCGTCKGSGQIRQTQRTMFGAMQTAAICNSCHGRGKSPQKPCNLCRGLGVERRESTIEIDIPGGIDENEVLRVNGQGEAAPHGGRAGDLYVRVHIKPDSRFERHGQDIISEVAVPFSMLVLGGTTEIETLDGKTTLKINEGTVPGNTITLRAQGIPFMRSKGRGDHVVRITAAVPKKLTKEQKKMLEEMKKEGM